MDRIGDDCLVELRARPTGIDCAHSSREDILCGNAERGTATLQSSCPNCQGYRIWPEDSVSAQGIEYSYPGRATVKWMRRLSGKNRTEFFPRIPTDSQIFPFCLLFRVISYLRHCSGTSFFKFGPIVSHSCFSWRLGGPCLCGCRLTPDGAQ